MPSVDTAVGISVLHSVAQWFEKVASELKTMFVPHAENFITCRNKRGRVHMEDKEITGLKKIRKLSGDLHVGCLFCF